MFEKILNAIRALFQGPISDQDVAVALDKRATESGEHLQWRSSIVDLLKAVSLPSDLTSRAKLAREIGYNGLLDGSAEMNQWLHAAVMKKIAEHGIKI